MTIKYTVSQYSYTLETTSKLHHPIINSVMYDGDYLDHRSPLINKLLRGFPWVDPIVVKRVKKGIIIFSEVVFGKYTLCAIAEVLKNNPNDSELENTPVPYYIIDFTSKEDYDSANDFIKGYPTNET